MGGPGPIVLWDDDGEPRPAGWVPAVDPSVLPGLPGGEAYISRNELERFADARVKQEVAAIRGLTLAGFIREWDRSKYGGGIG